MKSLKAESFKWEQLKSAFPGEQVTIVCRSVAERLSKYGCAYAAKRTHMDAFEGVKDLKIEQAGLNVLVTLVPEDE